jgi:CRP-like cAMP-binding protein
MDQKLELLAAVPLLAGLDRKDLEAVGQLAEEVDVGAGKVLAQQGAWGHEFFVIVSGDVAIERDGEHLRDLGPGDFLGELALIGGTPRTATATTTTAARLLVLGQGQFRDLLSSYPSIRTAVLEAVGQRLAALEPDRA